ncbi:hypothetical protein MKZ38_002643 [Zalerion maritima]|uniref:ABC transporter domain-containing protein n=1 Tax=Zalerion maritima TaxID=339359 RepID=A0AAD5RX18_9PEZI|nr:hypothetical protein MKZ38_002643 [Zalerion maritima]
METSATTDTDYERGYRKEDARSVDVEELAEAEAHLRNTTIQNFTWRNVSVAVRDRVSKETKLILENVEGQASAGELVALMGPSGSGKTTLLNVLARRPTNAENVEGSVLINGSKVSSQNFRDVTAYVEQEDSIIGSLTVRETLHFASRLSSSGSLPAKERIVRINGLLKAFGLTSQSETLIGTPIRKGISGGQKRRVGVASQLITSPKIMFLDEPTSGLDSRASFEVVNYLRGVAKRNKLLVIASIHQPSTSSFNLFDQVLLLSAGKSHYFGPVSGITDHYEREMGIDMPLHSNPAEFLLDLVNIDFDLEQDSATQRLTELQGKWSSSSRCKNLSSVISQIEQRGQGRDLGIEHHEKRPSMPSRTLALLHRAFIKSYRDVIAYGIRLAMYMGLAIMMGTVWLRLDAHDSNIVAFTNAIFFGGAFMSFMAIAYSPSFLEDHATFRKERHNGMYGPLEFMISNFLIGVPYLFLIALIFSAIAYWLINLQPAVENFFVCILWLFLDLLAAEGLVVLVASIIPSFVVTLAIVAFCNGLWMSVMGFMVYPDDLNVFYKYVFHYWDYQKYVFEGLMVNEFADRIYDCAKTGPGEGDCHCQWQSDLAGQCQVDGRQGVLETYSFNPDNFGRNVGIMLAIVVGYRIAALIVLVIKRN